MMTLACKADVLKSACISGALPVVKVTAHWSSRCSVIWWSRVLRAVTKGRVRVAVWVLVFSPTVRAWPSLCSVGVGHVFVPRFLMALIPTKVGVGSSHCTKLPVISEPGLQWKGVAGGCYALVPNQLQCMCRVVGKQYY